MAGRKEYDLETLKLKILEATKEIIIKKGYKELNIRDIAAAVGCSVGTLYNVFKNIYDIILHINSETLDHLQTRVEKEQLRKKNKASFTKDIGKIYIQFARDNLPIWSLLFEYQHPQDESLPRWYQAKVDHLFSSLESSLAHQFVGDKKKLKRISRSLWAGLHGICVLEVSGKLKTTKSESPEKLWDTLYKIYTKVLEAR